MERFRAQNSSSLVNRIVERQLQARPQLRQSYTPWQMQMMRDDIKFHLDHLVESIAIEAPNLFEEYVRWTRYVLEARGIPGPILQETFDCIRAELQDWNDGSLAEVAAPYLDRATTACTASLPPLASFIEDSNPHQELALEILKHLTTSESHQVWDLVVDARNSRRLPLKELYLNVFQPLQYEIGRLWQLNEITVAQEHYATSMVRTLVASFYPEIRPVSSSQRTLVATCVGTERHELGIRMVADFFLMDGWHVVYLGADTPSRDVLSAIEQARAQILAISTALLIHIGETRDLVRAVRAREAEKEKRTHIMVGGLPFNSVPDLWKRIGADAFASRADEAVCVANRLLEAG